MRQLPATAPSHRQVLAEICAFDWAAATEEDAICSAWAYYYFSVQFRENLEVACELYPEDDNLRRLKREECATDNLSPYPGIAAAQERMDHDEFMRRVLCQLPIADGPRASFYEAGASYLRDSRAMDPIARALSISSYEDGGLEAVFTAMLRMPDYENPGLRAFRFFLSEHVRFDSDPNEGHGSLSRHLIPDDSVLPAWVGFRELFTHFTPRLALAASRLVTEPAPC